jgi:hypothetical protein
LSGTSINNGHGEILSLPDHIHYTFLHCTMFTRFFNCDNATCLYLKHDLHQKNSTNLFAFRVALSVLFLMRLPLLFVFYLARKLSIISDTLRPSYFVVSNSVFHWYMAFMKQHIWHVYRLHWQL